MTVLPTPDGKFVVADKAAPRSPGPSILTAKPGSLDRIDCVSVSRAEKTREFIVNQMALSANPPRSD